MDDQELSRLLAQWAAVEPERCRQQAADRFAVCYAEQWVEALPQSTGHGAIIAAVLEGCARHQIYCNIEYTPRYEEEPPTIQVGCLHRAFRWREGDEVIYSIPTLLLTEYLERLQANQATP